MRITPYFSGERFDQETTRIMSVAFEIVRVALRLADRDDALSTVIAHRIIELSRAGERNPDLLCERVLFEFATPTNSETPPHPSAARVGGTGTGPAVAR
jgi:hypothetical protein